MIACEQTLSVCVGALATALTSIVIAVVSLLKAAKK